MNSLEFLNEILPEVSAGTRILKVKLPGFDDVMIPRNSRGEAHSGRGPKDRATVLPDEIDHLNPMIMNSTGFLPLRAPAGGA